VRGACRLDTYEHKTRQRLT